MTTAEHVGRIIEEIEKIAKHASADVQVPLRLAVGDLQAAVMTDAFANAAANPPATA